MIKQNYMKAALLIKPKFIPRTISLAMANLCTFDFYMCTFL